MNEPTRTAHNVLRFWPAIELVARRFEVPPLLLASLVAQESGGVPWATRSEKGYRWLFGDDPGEHLVKPTNSTQATEWMGQACSWGLCQVMGATARGLGMRGWLSQLCEPEVGLHYGAKYLSWCIRRAENSMEGGLLKYNGGGDPDYPAKVLGWISPLEEALAA